MKVLVTGSTGFIGGHVIRELLNSGHEVVATGTSEEKAKKKQWFSAVKFVPHVIEEEKSSENLVAKFYHPDCLIHLAWQGLPNYNSLFHIEENLPRQYCFLKGLVNDGLSDITITGTCFEYGMKTGLLREDMPVEPANPYAIAKNSLRLFLEQLQKEKHFYFKWIRLFYMYGKGQNAKSLFSQLESALSNREETFNMSGGEQVRDYMPIEDVAVNIVKIALQREITGVINCSSNNPVKLKDLVSQYLYDQGKSIKLNLGYYPYPDYEPFEFWGDNKKLKNII